MLKTAANTALFIAICLVIYAFADHFMPRDDSDPPGGRSGFAIYKDALTGCEYIGRGFILIQFVPRMGSDGKQICRKGGA